MKKHKRYNLGDKIIKCCGINVNGKIEETHILLKDICRFLDQRESRIEIICKIGFHDCHAVTLGVKDAQEKAELPINMAGTLWLNGHGLQQIIHGGLLVVGQVPKEEVFSDCPLQVFQQVPYLQEDSPNFKFIDCGGIESIDGIIDIIDTDPPSGWWKGDLGGEL